MEDVTLVTTNDKGELVLIFDQPAGSDRIAGDFVNRPEVIEVIESTIQEMIKKTVTVKVEINSSGVSSQDTKTDVRDFFANVGIEIEQDEN